MIALKPFENKSFGKIAKGDKIPESVLRKMDVKGLLDAGFIKDDSKKEDKKK